MQMLRVHALHVVVIATFSVVAYLPAFDAGFVFDDIPNIVNNPLTQPETLGDLADGQYTRGHDNFIRDRTVAMFTFALNHLVSGLDTFSYHAVNVAIHAVNAILLYALIVLMVGIRDSRQTWIVDRPAAVFALLAALLWALHPVNTQAVTYIVQRMTSLCAMFYLLAMVSFVLFRLEKLHPRVALPIIGGSFLLGMGTKPIMITLPAGLLLLDLYVQRRWLRAHLVMVFGILGLAALVTVIWGSTLLAQFTQEYPGRHFSGYERLMTEGRVLWHYLGLWFWPDPGRLQLDYEIAVSRGWFSPPTTVVAWSSIGLVSVAVGMAARRAPWLALAWFFFLIASSVEASFLNLELVFEHRMYLPSIFIFAGVLAFVPSTAFRRATVTIPVFVLAGGLAIATVERNREWADIGSFWAHELERGASPNRAAQNAALRYSMAGQPGNALAVVDRALPDAEGVARAQLLQQKGEAQFALGRIDDAMETFSKTYAMAPNWTRNRYFLGRVALARGDVESASRLADEVQESYPRSSFAAALRSLVLQAQERPEEAVALLEQYLDQPRESLQGGTEAFLRMHLAGAYRSMDEPSRAYAQYQRIVDRDPRHWAAWVNIYRMLVAGGDIEQAERVKRYLQERNVDIEGWTRRDESLD